MPVTSPAQYGYMASHMDAGGALGRVAKDFVDKTSRSKRSNFAKVLASKKKKKLVVDSDNDYK